MEDGKKRNAQSADRVAVSFVHLSAQHGEMSLDLIAMKNKIHRARI